MRGARIVPSCIESPDGDARSELTSSHIVKSFGRWDRGPEIGMLYILEVASAFFRVFHYPFRVSFFSRKTVLGSLRNGPAELAVSCAPRVS
eukprot:6353190-Prymnesium_polylepis.1